jgi:hypothetical protein
MKSFIFLNHEGKEIDYNRFIDAGMLLWRYLHQELTKTLEEKLSLESIIDDTLIIAEESDVTRDLLSARESNKIIFINFESSLYLQKPALKDNMIRVDFGRYNFPLDNYHKILRHYKKALGDIHNKKKMVCLVASNKSRGKIDRFYGNIMNVKGVLLNKPWQKGIITNLSRREKFILQCSKVKQLDIVGSNWNLFLPILFTRNIKNRSRIADKRKFLSDFKFTIAFENIEEKGYITEKIPEAIMCGTCPIVPEYFVNAAMVPIGLYCTETEFLKNPNKCWVEFSERFTDVETLKYLMKFTVESVGSAILKHEVFNEF